MSDSVGGGLGETLKSLRKAAGLTQQQLAAEADMSYSAMAKLEQGSISKPSADTMHKISTVLGIGMHELMGGIHKAATPAEPKEAETVAESIDAVKFVYCDVGRVLVHVNPALQALSAHVGRGLEETKGVYYTYAPLAFKGYLTLEQLLEVVCQKLHVECNKDNKDELIGVWLGGLKAMDHMQEQLIKISKDFPIGLLTNSIDGYLDQLREYKLLPEIDYAAVVDSASVRLSKPSREIYEHAEKAAGFSGGKILFIDDSRPNMDMAEEMGWQTIWFDELDEKGSVERIAQDDRLRSR